MIQSRSLPREGAEDDDNYFREVLVSTPVSTPVSTLWQVIAFGCAAGWLANLSISVYAHRVLSHRAVVLHPAVNHVFRLLIWLTTGTRVRGWVAVHRQHHAYVDRQGDPHSPVIYGIRSIFFGVYWHYRRASMDAQTLAKYGDGCPDDWLERTIYRRGLLGLIVLWSIEVALFGPAYAPLAVAIQIFWMPLMAGIINGLGHYFGYRNYDTRDASRNIVPLGILIAGEELHNNHHHFPRSARFSSRLWEVDMSWALIRLLATCGLAREIYVFGRRWDATGKLPATPSATEPVAQEW